MPNRSAHHTTGLNGESIAERYLEQNGYKILNRRYRCRNGEIDIVADTSAFIVFVEVKTVRAKPGEEIPFGEPETRISTYKQRALRRCAEHYLWKHEITGRDCRFDLITIRLTGDAPDINHLENIL